jgi:hypothetical protein
MTLQNMFLMNSSISVFFSLILLLMPAIILELFGLSSGPSEKLLIQFFGAQLLGTGLMTLFGLKTKELRSQRTITLSYFIAYVIGFIVSLGGMLSNVMNVLGWGIALVFLFLALGFGYFQFIGPSS